MLDRYSLKWVWNDLDEFCFRWLKIGIFPLFIKCLSLISKSRKKNPKIEISPSVLRGNKIQKNFQSFFGLNFVSVNDTQWRNRTFAYVELWPCFSHVTSLSNCHVWRHKCQTKYFWIFFPKMTLSYPRYIPKILPIGVKSELTAVFLINACWYFTWDFFRFRLNWTIFSGTSSESSLLHIFATNRALKSIFFSSV